MSGKVSRSINIQAGATAVWSVVADIECSAAVLSGIERVEILEPASGPSIIGLKWRETRMWMGKEAQEDMWVTDASEPFYYETRAESHGSVYTSRIELEPDNSGTRLIMSFHASPVTFSAKLMWMLTGWMARKSLVKVIERDLDDLKRAVEQDAG